MAREPGGSPHQAAAPGSAEILNRDSEPGSGQQLHLQDLLLPRSLGSILKSVRAIHNPPTPAPLGWNSPPAPPLQCLRKPPGPPIDALMTSAALKRLPHSGNGLKSALSDPPRILQRVESEIIPLQGSHSLGQSAAEPAGRRPAVRSTISPEEKPQHPSQRQSPRRQSLAGTPGAELSQTHQTYQAQPRRE